MKKVALILMVLVSSVLLLTGCTDQSKELKERIELENEIREKLIDNKEVGDEETDVPQE